MTEFYLRSRKDPILRTICEPVVDFKQLPPLVDAMKQIMRQQGAVGIAAPQVGDTRRVFITRVKKNYTRVFVNPKITEAHGYVPFVEGCLSMPGILVPTLRRYEIKTEYRTEAGHYASTTLKGMDAIVFQHELDHLNGVLAHQYVKRFRSY